RLVLHQTSTSSSHGCIPLADSIRRKAYGRVSATCGSSSDYAVRRRRAGHGGHLDDLAAPVRDVVQAQLPARQVTPSILLPTVLLAQPVAIARIRHVRGDPPPGRSAEQPRADRNPG